MKRDLVRRSRRPAAWVILAVLSVSLSMALTQCQLVQDRLTGVHLAKGQAAGNCIAACAHAYNDSILAESDLHVSNVHGCGGDSTCLAGLCVRECRQDADCPAQTYCVEHSHCGR